MKNYFYVLGIVLTTSLCAGVSTADTGGALPESPSSIKEPPTAGALQTDITGAPKLVVEFQTAHAEIPPSYSANLNAFGKYLVDHPDQMAKIDGYADHTGHGPANAALAQKRADAVKDYLTSHFTVASSRITAQGYGEVSTKTRNSTEEGKQVNRSAIGTIVLAKS